jgi:uncharacterized protein YecE (DUF72 family)
MTARKLVWAVRAGSTSGNFYPADMPPLRWLDYYTSRFDTVEINNTFYRLPEASALAAWRKRVPKDFLFAIKASRYLTHMKKLKDPEQPIERLLSRARRLGAALGPILYQLPPHWPVNIERLTLFLGNLPNAFRHAIEFRDPSWYTPEVFALLERHRVACCLHDMAGSATGRLVMHANAPAESDPCIVQCGLSTTLMHSSRLSAKTCCANGASGRALVHTVRHD